MGVPASLELARMTRPYYRSTYVFLSRGGSRPVTSLDDPALEKLRIGVQPWRPANPYAGQLGAASEGRELFVRMNCSGCHGEHADGGMGPSVARERHSELMTHN
jgi:mono/diheme cytochrome c family protein